MKTLFILASVMVVLFLASSSLKAQRRITTINRGYVTTGNVTIPAVGLIKIDPTKVKFLTKGRPCSVTYGTPWDIKPVDMRVMGVVASDVDLSDDATAQQLIQMGITFGREQCPPGGEFYDSGRVLRGDVDAEGRPVRRNVSVTLYPGNPMTFTSADIEKFFDGRRGNGMVPGLDQLLDEVYGYWVDYKPGLIINYTNYPKALKLSDAWDAQEKRKREAVLEQQRHAEQSRRNQIAARVAAFVKANKVKRFVNGSQLAANPFVYQGQVVGMIATFVRMKSATQAIFSNGNNSFVVSGVPTVRFTRQGSLLMLAGRVSETGDLTFVGSVFCQERGCSDYIQ